MAQAGALSGLVVLDLSRRISGSYCAKLLGAHGAEVIKVEAPGTGDPARRAGPFPPDGPHPEKSATFLYLNTNKKSITLDITRPEGADLLRRLVQGADVAVENFAPGFLTGLGLDYARLSAGHPGLVMASISPFGLSGPYRDFAGGRLAENALSGYMFINGAPDREPLAGGGEQPAYQGGLNALAGIMAALVSRLATGRGRFVEVSILECMAAIHQFTVNRYVYSGRVEKRVGNRYMWAHPITIYRTRDGYVSISASTDEQTERLLQLMGLADLLEDPRFVNGFLRLKNADAFDGRVGPWFLEKSTAEIVRECQEWRVPTAFVHDAASVLRDEQYAARGYFVTLDHPEAGPQPYAGPPFRLSLTPAANARAPLLGEHNDDIYIGRLGLSRKDLDGLKARGVV